MVRQERGGHGGRGGGGGGGAVPPVAIAAVVGLLWGPRQLALADGLDEEFLFGLVFLWCGLRGGVCWGGDRLGSS